MTTKTFTMNGKAYETDSQTLDMLRTIVPAAKSTGDASAVAFAMTLGEMCGRIREVGTVLNEAECKASGKWNPYTSVD